MFGLSTYGDSRELEHFVRDEAIPELTMTNFIINQLRRLIAT